MTKKEAACFQREALSGIMQGRMFSKAWLLSKPSSCDPLALLPSVHRSSSLLFISCTEVRAPTNYCFSMKQNVRLAVTPATGEKDVYFRFGDLKMSTDFKQKKPHLEMYYSL